MDMGTYFAVTTLVDRGWPLPRWRHGRGGVPARIEIRESHDDDAHPSRIRLVAKATGPGGGRDLLPPLRDATVVYMLGDEMMIAGIERLEDERLPDRHRDYAQTWFCKRIPDASAATVFATPAPPLEHGGS
jgi:hypothetical protein